MACHQAAERLADASQHEASGRVRTTQDKARWTDEVTAEEQPKDFVCRACQDPDEWWARQEPPVLQKQRIDKFGLRRTHRARPNLVKAGQAQKRGAMQQHRPVAPPFPL